MHAHGLIHMQSWTIFVKRALFFGTTVYKLTISLWISRILKITSNSV